MMKPTSLERPRQSRLIGMIAAATMAAAAITLVGASGTADATTVTPRYVEGNLSCADLGYAFGYKPQPEPPPSGTYTIPGTSYTVTLTRLGDGATVDWSSTLSMDAVIMKGGPGANVYSYSPESFGDTGLVTPTNPNNTNGEPYGLSHVEFCYDFELAVSKTANTSYTRTYTWGIDKTVGDDEHVGWAGDSFTSKYTVTVTRTDTDSDHTISGTITIVNPAPVEVTFSVSDSITGVGAVTPSCPSNKVAAGSTVECTYTTAVSGKDGTLNTAVVTSSTRGVSGGTATANVVWGDPTTTVGYPSVNVTDTVKGSLGPAGSGSTEFRYEQGFTCPESGYDTNGKYTKTFPNTATITETEQSDDESVALTCYKPGVAKTAIASYDRDWTWTIDKSADQTELLLSDGQLLPVNYEVKVSGLSQDSNFAVSGKITITLPAGAPALTATVSDVLSDGTVGEITSCSPGTLTGTELVIPAGTDEVVCDYTAEPTSATATSNTATLTLPSGQKITSTVDVDWDVVETDECIDVSDTNDGTLGTVCGSGSSAEQTFEYTLDFGRNPDADVVLECGPNTHENTASFLANDTEATDSDTWTVTATVACDTGCTLTQGYWKTHSTYGPAPYDDTWAQIGEDTPFFLSGKTWYQVLWTAPAGNPYYVLAHQYIAAKLNILNGASSTSDVIAKIAYAENLFSQKTPTQVADFKGPARNAVINAASILDRYNNGLIGPGHCSE